MDMAGMNSTGGHGHGRAMMHMTFFWGKNAEILFSSWPGHDNLGMYILSLAVVFTLAFVVEWLSKYSNYYIEEHYCGGSNQVAAGLLEAAVYGLRIGVAYVVMLAVMSFNGGVFLLAVAGHALGYFLFGSVAFKKSPLNSYVKRSDFTTPNDL